MRIGTISARLAGLCAAFYLMLTAALLLSILHRTGGHFVYALDDPYIHLALAENLAHGHYGLNATEFASPASSILWPFLLVPFSGTSVHGLMPLVLNILFGTTAAALLGYAAAQYRSGSWSKTASDNGDATLHWQHIVLGALLVLCANLASLTIVGMEHVLQILLAICCAFGVVAILQGRTVPVWCLAAGLLAPMIRYEDLSLTLAMAIALVGLRRWKTAIALFSLSLVPLIGFSLYLKSKGLPALPMSVLVKGDVYANASPAMKLVRLVTGSVRADFTHLDHLPVLLLFVLFAVLTWKATDRVRRFVCASAAVLAASQLTVGRFGWFHRYEVYALVFLLVVGLAVLSGSRTLGFRCAVIFLALSSAEYVYATLRTPFAAQQIYLQQYQMHRFVTEFYHGNYAVNDIGLVSFQRTRGSYVLDAFGLASEEAAAQQNKTAAWLQGIVERKDVSLAILYPALFQIPPSWTPLARMCVPWKTGLNIQFPCVVFYSTTAGGESALRSDLHSFSGTLPAGVEFTSLP
jgi:hypothetical protein